MCAAPNSTNSNRTHVSPTSTSRTTNQPNQKKKFHSQGKQAGLRTESSSSKVNQQSRSAKRARWAKKNKPVAKPVKFSGPVNEYPCVCHGEAARKPRAGQKDSVKDPETGKIKDKPKGLGHWRCAVTGKATKVSARKPQPKVDAIPGSTAQPTIPTNAEVAVAPVA